jgi:hypothetical protein
MKKSCVHLLVPILDPFPVDYIHLHLAAEPYYAGKIITMIGGFTPGEMIV